MSTDTTTAPNRAIALELINTEDGHNKLYRVYLFGKVVLAEWGSRNPGSKIRNLPYVQDSVAKAQAFMAELVAKKEKDGYRLSVSPRVVTVPQDVADLIARGAAPAERFGDLLYTSTEIV